MGESKERMILEEQGILNDLIQKMEKVGYSLQRTLTGSVAKLKDAKESSVPEAYGSIIDASNTIKETKTALKEFHRSRDELYDTRLVLEYMSNEGQGLDELKVGLHDYGKDGEIYVISWIREACRPFILNDSLIESDCVINEKYGKQYVTHYTLRLKRQIDMVFDTVKDVTHLFPLITEEEEQIIADEFLKELLKRRTEQEFQNIVFSIQKQQGEIIQTPFKQNLIVQGCAGSGKSMIMLHRLPIILYDNPKSLNRNNLYIITPSITYIQMANNMRIDLEIEDLKMGTLNQYYDYVISKYGRDPGAYGTINPGSHLSKEHQDFIFSKELTRYIKYIIESEISQNDVDCEKGFRLFGLEKKMVNDDTYAQCLRNKLASIEPILNENDRVLRQQYYTPLRKSIEKLTEIERMLFSRKTAVTRRIHQLIFQEQDTIEKATKKIRKLDPEKNKKACRNNQEIINSSSTRISELEKVLLEVDGNSEYFDRLEKLGTDLDKVLSLFSEILNEWHEIGMDQIYRMVEKRKFLVDSYVNLVTVLNEIEDLYWEFAGSMREEIKIIKPIIQQIVDNKGTFLPLEYQKALAESNLYYKSLEQNIVDRVYLSIMEKLGNVPKEGKKITAFSCSPFIYLQILYLYQGSPNSVKESLITIDEAQNLDPEELLLIYNVNDKKVIFNLFGDVKQHFEEKKGIDSWKAFSPIIDYRLYEMKENYRNARQITRYCNRMFGMNMRAINTDGKGVHMLDDAATLYEHLRTIFQRPQNPGLSCIIVKSIDEARTVYDEMGTLQNRIHNLAADPSELKNVKWNLMTIDQAKGLEFETVITISGRMTDNEKYVAFTRALDELFIYNSEIELLPILRKTEPHSTVDITKKTSSRKKRNNKDCDEKNNSAIPNEKGCKEFFEQLGMKVIDERNQGGYLWVVGRREMIEEAVNFAIEKFGISGKYSPGKTTHFGPGWYTKTKK